jgi:hypothetical protein
MSTPELALHEERAQHGIIEFAEEMQFIREHNLYPNAGETHGGKLEPWATYCKERWGMSKTNVNDAIRALPVLQRLGSTDMSSKPSVSAAAAVSTLPEPVQDVILTDSPKRNDASDKAKAVRKEAKRIETQEGREPTVEELVEVAKRDPKPKRKPKPKHKSRFTSLLAQAVAFAEDAADHAQSNPLSDIENEFGWSRVGKLREHTERIDEVLREIGRPDHVRDLDEEWAPVLGGDE